MKKLLIVAFVACSQLINAQVTRNLGDFSEVKVFDKISLKLIPASENKTVVTGSRADEVEVVNKNGILKIRMPLNQLLAGDAIAVKLYFKKIEGISANEGSFVSCDSKLAQAALNVVSNSGAEINLDIDVDKLTVKANAGGIVDISGKAENQDVLITSGGILKAKDLHTVHTTISVAAGGNADVYATSLVDAKVKAGGSVFVHGKPKQINKEVFIGGTIVEK